MHKFENFTLSLKTLNILVFLFPLAFILGNSALNTLVFLIGLLGLIVYKKQVFQIRKSKLLISISCFFLYLILISLYEDFKNPKNVEVIKSFLYLRFLLLTLVLRCMMNNDEFELKYFLIICLFFVLFVSIDLTIQSIFGTNLLGFQSTQYHNSGVFNLERVAGGYISRFLYLGVFSVPLILNKKIKINFNLFFIFIFLIGITGLLLSGNRMPSVMLLVYSLLMIIYFKDLRIVSSALLILSIVIFLISLSLDEDYKRYYRSFYGNVVNITLSFTDLTKKFISEKINKKTSQLSIHQEDANVAWEGEQWVWGFWSGHGIIYLTALDIFRDRPILGHGIKSFRVRCKLKNNKFSRICSLHTHNYYLEILTDTGLIGFVLFVGPIYFLLFKNLVSRSRESFEKHQIFFYSLLFILIMEFFPLKSSGSIFSTNSATYVFLILGLLLNDKIKNFFRD